jgi:hypothetical protein
MAFKESTGIRNANLVTGSITSLLNGGFIKIYSGPSPATADAAITGTLLCTISNNSTATGLTFETSASGGSVTKKLAEVWSGVNAATGTAGYYRFVTPTDDGTLSTTQYRLQGDIATAGAELNLSSISLTAGATQTIDYFVYSRPTL